MTSVGGTSLENFNPGANPSPKYPTGQETVWNYLNLCNATATNEDGLSGFDWCAGDGAGAGTPETNNGLFPTVKGYDEATGIGTPNMTALITLSL